MIHLRRWIKMQFLISYIIYIIIFLLLTPLLTFISIVLFFTQGLPIIHWSKRIGKKNKIFMMPKFRTMHSDTPNVATHLLKDPKTSVTKIGSFLRKYSLDETSSNIPNSGQYVISRTKTCII